MTMRGQAKFFGWFFLAFGILGFIPGITTGALLFGIFHVNAAMNLIHMITGAVFLWAGMQTDCASMRSFQAFGVIYALFGLIGLTSMGAMFVGPVAVNAAETLFHLIVAAITLFIGFFEPVRHPVKCAT